MTTKREPKREPETKADEMSTPTRRLTTFAAALTITLGVSGSAAADEPASADAPQESGGSKHAIDRTWLYLDDAKVPAPLDVIAMTSASVTHVGASPTRIDSDAPPYKGFSGNTATQGVLLSLGGEVGLLPHVSVMALGQTGVAGDGSSPNVGALAGLRFQLLPSSIESVHLVASVGYLREAWTVPGQGSGNNGAWAQAAVTGDINRFRFGATVHGEHVFAEGRDAVDLMVQLGATVRVIDAFRVGVEYVGQDLEEIGGDEAEAGARHFLGPTASVRLLSDRLTLTGGPSVGLSASSPKVLGRLAISYGF
jgi:hypothetical protein